MTSNPEAPADPEPGADTGDESVQDETAAFEGDAGSAVARSAADRVDWTPAETETASSDDVNASFEASNSGETTSEVAPNAALPGGHETPDEGELTFGASDGDESDEVASLFAVAFEHIRDEDSEADDLAEPSGSADSASADADFGAALTADATAGEGAALAESTTAAEPVAASPDTDQVDDSAVVEEKLSDRNAAGSETSEISSLSADDANADPVDAEVIEPTVSNIDHTATDIALAAAAVAPLIAASTAEAAPVAAEVTAAAASTVVASSDALPQSDQTAPAWADASSPATALTWVNPAAVSASTPSVAFSTASTEVAADDVLAESRLRPGFLRSGVLVPLGTLVVLTAAYAGTMLLWPLNEVAPTIEGVAIEAVPAAPATLTWPAEGAAAIGVEGISSLASTGEELPIASISKVVSSLMVLDAMPLQPGEAGPEYGFTYGDNLDYWTYRSQDQSALDVPVGGVLTEYQLLQGTLIGSANNYIDHLADDIWSSDREFADAAEEWLEARGLGAITIRTPSGFDDRNVSTPEALLALSEKALQNPVVAEIVATQSVELPGAGLVVNTNGMLADPGVIGVKTGTLEEDWNLLTAKEVTVGDTTVRLHVAALGQVDDEKRLETTRSLLAEVEAALNAQAPVVPAGTRVGSVETMWGDSVDIVTESDAEVVLWNAATADTTIEFDLGETRDQDGTVGTLSVSGPIDDTSVATVLTSDVEGPSVWWRLTHPLDLLGLND